MRVSAQLITKVVSEAVSKNHLAGTVSGAGKDAVRGTRPSRANQLGEANRSMYSAPPKITGADHKAAMRSLAHAERDMNVRAGSKSNKSDKFYTTRKDQAAAAEWTNGDGARSNAIGNKLARMMRDAVMSVIEDDTPSHFLTALELGTIQKMTLQELTDVIDDSPSAFRIAGDIAKWAKRNS